MPVISTIIAPAVISALGVTGAFATAAVTFGVRLVTSLVLSKLLLRNAMKQDRGGEQPAGARIQLQPATFNKVPVVYGDAFVNPIITDAILSEDNQTMWYVLTFSEKTDTGTIKFKELYWADKQIVMDPDNANEILGWYDKATGELDTRPAGKIQVYFYNTDSATTGTEYQVTTASVFAQNLTTATAVLSDSGIVEADRWNGTQQMKDSVFVIIKMAFDQNIGLTGLPTITAHISNSLKQPGSVILDYLSNTRYGCSVPMAKIDTSATTLLNTYAGQTISVTEAGTGIVTTATRFEINGVLDSNQSCLDNLVTIADHADSWIQWNEINGQWSVKVNQSLQEAGLTTSSPRVITTSSIIGGINVTPLDLNQTYNKFRVEFPNKEIKDQTDFRYYTLDPNLKDPNEPDNEMQLRMPLLNSSVQADYIGRRRLFQSREDYIITFAMDYSGIQIDAGDVIVVQHDWYGWNQGTYGNAVYAGKPFRVTQVKEEKTSDGFLIAQITASSYNDTVYTAALDAHSFTEASFNALDDPNAISKPNAPTFPATLVDNTAGSYVVQGEIPVQGNVSAMEFWFSVKGADLTADNNYVHYSTQNYNNGALYPHYCDDGSLFYEQTKAISVPTATYWWRTRAVGPTGQRSEFSNASTAFVWTLQPTTDGSQIKDDTITGNKVSEGDPGLVGQSGSGNFFDGLGSTALAGLGAAAGYYLYQQGQLPWPKEQSVFGGGVEPISQPTVVDTWVEYNSYPNNPQVGETIEFVVDVTPDPGYIENYTSWGSFTAPPFDPDTGSYGGDFDFDNYGDFA